MGCLILFFGWKLKFLGQQFHIYSKSSLARYICFNQDPLMFFELHTYYGISPEDQHGTVYSLCIYLKFSLTEEIPVCFCKIMFFSKVLYLMVHIFCLFTKLQGNELLLITLFRYQLVLFPQRVGEECFRKAYWKAAVLLLHLFKLGLVLTGVLWIGDAVNLWKARKKRNQILACD